MSSRETWNMSWYAIPVAELTQSTTTSGLYFWIRRYRLDRFRTGPESYSTMSSMIIVRYFRFDRTASRGMSFNSSRTNMFPHQGMKKFFPASG